MNYLFILGRDPDLSLLELECYFESRNIEYKILDYTQQAAVVTLPKIDFKKLIKELGGTIKIAEIFSSSGNLSEIEYEFNKMDINFSDKMDYCISNYNTDLTEFVRDLIKSRLKKEHVKAIYRKPKRKTDKFLTPTELINKKIIKTGLDIVIFKNYIARTIVIYDPFELEELDENRPKKDFLKATSLRLAKILVNLSQIKPTGTLLDPFCGMGTILQEALLNGINVIGIDLDRKSVEDTKENIKWLRANYEIKTKSEVYSGNSRYLSEVIKNKVDGVVTEPYMGPFLRKKPTKEQAISIINELKPIYRDLLSEISKIITKNGKIVIIMPEFDDIWINPLNITDNFRLYSPRISIKLPVPYILKNSFIKRYIYILEQK